VTPVAAFLPRTRRLGGLLSGWRGLAHFWGLLLLLLVVSGGVLQTLGPPPIRLVTAPFKSPIDAVAHIDPPSVSLPPGVKTQDTAKRSAQIPRPGRVTPGPTFDPDPALLQPVAGDPRLVLPRISIDGRAPMSAYAAGFDASTLRPRVGILIAGIGMSEADSLAAIKTLPGGVTLAISPDANDVSHLLSVARSNEHEYLLSVPMEPQGYPVNDPDDRSALMTSLPQDQNLARLRAILGRLTGYVGITNALGSMRGERLAGMADQLDTVLEEAGNRGLLFMDARTGQKAQAHAWSRSADIVLDEEPLNAAVLDKRLDTLTHLALDKGSAVGIVSAPRPVTVDRVAAWANTLASKGLALAPVSALVLPPGKPDQEK
jgi:polysaccharide deacetylase 2 family uncharacterized protein YibQ